MVLGLIDTFILPLIDFHTACPTTGCIRGAIYAVKNVYAN